MKTVLQKGQILDSGFEILEVKNLPEFEADGIWARHVKSGAQVFHVLNDDRENLFSFTFTTIPEDSTGVPHILEHSVLCGSEHYPLKDAFLVLAQGSLQTYLNAWTFPDKTVYPASSVNERDYFNLMAVYGDAVFRPLISEWTFLQEGHRLVFKEGSASGSEAGDAGRLELTGVVYNEMKGAYSSLDAYAGLWSVRSVLPDTPYAFESGGDPDHITSLSWEALKEFHRSRYSPANCRVFLAGDIPTEKQLAFLNEKFFSSLPPGKAAPPIPRAERWKENRTFTIPCPAGEQKSTVFLSFLCGTTVDVEETLDLAALGETLFGHDGSPLTRALIESGLGEDLAPVTGLEGELQETIFSVGLRGVEPQNQKKTEELIFGELRRLVKEGIPQAEVEAALLGMEFSHKEIRRAGGPFSLVWLRRSLRTWLHGGTPWDSLLFAPLFDGLKRRLSSSPRYLEGLIQKYFLDNPHRALVIIEPQKGFLEKQEAELAEQLKQKEAALSSREKQGMLKKNQDLTRIQEQPDSAQALASIPHLSRGDLSPEIEIIPREYFDASGIPVLQHTLFTNAISYADIAFPVDTLDAEDYQWLPFFSRVLISLGLPGMDYGEVSGLLARTAGGFRATLESGSQVPGSSRAVAFPGGIFDIRGREWIIYRLKALDEKFGASLDIARRLIGEADFSDLKRIRDLVLEMRSELDSGLAPMGSQYAAFRSSRGFTRSCCINETWYGLEQLRFVHQIAELDAAELSRKLSSIRDRLFGSGALVNFTCGASSVKNGIREIASCFGRLGPPRPRNASLPVQPHAGILPAPSGKPAPEIFASPSLQVGFAASVLPVTLFGAGPQAAEQVLSHLLSTGPLWEEIRMKGGAYGVFAQPDILEGTFNFSTYRDPNPSKSLETFRAVLNSFAGFEEVEKAVIGSYARETRPRTSVEKGLQDFVRLLYGIEDHHRSRRLAALINTGEEEIREVLGMLASANSPCPVIVTGERDAEKAAAALGVTPQKLPV